MNFSLQSPSATGATPPPAMRELPELQRPSSPRRRSKGRLGKVVLAGGAVALAAGGVIGLGVPGFRKPFKPLSSLFAGAANEALTFPVRAADLPVIVSERGTL